MALNWSYQLSLAPLMKSEKYSDLKIVCRGEVFNVHKAIVCIQSPVMAAAIDGGFQEATTGTINMDEFGIETVKRMIEFMYTREYNQGTEDQPEVVGTGIDNGSSKVEGEGTSLPDDDGTNDQEPPVAHPTVATSNDVSNPTTETLLRHVRVNAIADYFDVSKLRQMANAKIMDLLEKTWSADGFADVVKETLDSTGDKIIHQIIALTATIHIDELLRRDDFINLNMGNEFAIGIIRNMAHKQEEFKTELRKFEDELRATKELQDWGLSRHERVMGGVERILNTLRETESCRNITCRADFTCYIEKLSEDNFQLRCDKCRCRHL